MILSRSFNLLSYTRLRLLFTQINILTILIVHSITLLPLIKLLHQIQLHILRLLTIIQLLLLSIVLLGRWLLMEGFWVLFLLPSLVDSTCLIRIPCNFFIFRVVSNINVYCFLLVIGLRNHINILIIRLYSMENLSNSIIQLLRRSYRLKLIQRRILCLLKHILLTITILYNRKVLNLIQKVLTRPLIIIKVIDNSTIIFI